MQQRTGIYQGCFLPGIFLASAFCSPLIQAQESEQQTEKKDSVPAAQIIPTVKAVPAAESIPAMRMIPKVKQDKTDDKKAEARQEKKEDKSADEKKKIETVAVESKNLLAQESFTGVLESTRTTEIKTDFDSWSDLVVESVVAQGTSVAPGKTLLKFKTEKLDKALKEAQLALKNAEFDVQNAELEMKLAQETFELEKGAAERAWKEAQDDYDYYLNTEYPNDLDDLEFSKKTSGYYLEYSKDELDQLEKMYKEDELVEESEEIVLKRTRRQVESAERSVARQKLNHQRQEAVLIPREKVTKEVAFKRAEFAYQRSLVTLPIARAKAEIALQQSRIALADKQKSFNELTADYAKMEIKATSAGVVYYGKCERGKWTGRKIEVDQKLGQDAVVMTIVDPSALMIRSSLEEAKLESLTTKLRGKAIVNALGNRPMPVVINTIDLISGEDDKYNCEIMIEKLPGETNVMPGMSCKMSFVVANRQALVVPKGSVFSDDGGVTHFVFVVKDETAKRIEVIVGKTVGEEKEILEGLQAGDQVAKTRQ